MKIDLTPQLLDINDEPLWDDRGRFLPDGNPEWLNPGAPEKELRQAVDRFPLILRTVVQGALLANMKTDETMTGEEKVRLWNLAQDSRADKVDWTPEELAIVRGRVGSGYAAMVVGPVFKLLG